MSSWISYPYPRAAYRRFQPKPESQGRRPHLRELFPVRRSLRVASHRASLVEILPGLFQAPSLSAPTATPGPRRLDLLCSLPRGRPGRERAAIRGAPELARARSCGDGEREQPAAPPALCVRRVGAPAPAPRAAVSSLGRSALTGRPRPPNRTSPAVQAADVDVVLGSFVISSADDERARLTPPPAGE